MLQSLESKKIVPDLFIKFQMSSRLEVRFRDAQLVDSSNTFYLEAYTRTSFDASEI